MIRRKIVGFSLHAKKYTFHPYNSLLVFEGKNECKLKVGKNENTVFLQECSHKTFRISVAKIPDSNNFVVNLK
ncbi:unnamed protein product [Heterobilharzia americana]|nr:unnamed protein product [Heterobilharzia americana]